MERDLHAFQMAQAAPALQAAPVIFLAFHMQDLTPAARPLVPP
ncbi:hypothetical protein [Rhizobium sp. CSW-27]|nr:hypothetical protein [Rhizobium sp. CSW-27]